MGRGSWVAVAVAVAVAVLTTGCAATVVAPATVTVTQPPGALQTPAARTPVAPIGVGTPVRDGALEFTVHGVRRATQIQRTTARNPIVADGEFVIVSLTVTNVGDQPQQYFTDSQSLVIDGKQHPADILGAVFLDQESAEFITPGLGIDIETPFDVPVGSVPEAIVLNDITNPGGVIVDLTGVPISAS